VTGFTNGEEDEVELTKVVPFLVENEMMRLGATTFSTKPGQAHHFLQGQELGRSHGGRWTVDHRPESGFVGTGRQISD
jgi:hypothetical protein